MDRPSMTESDARLGIHDKTVLRLAQQLQGES